MKSTKLVITGRPISKKNSKRLVRMGNRTVPISSKAYMKFEQHALEQLLSQKQVKFDTHIQVDYEFYVKGKYHVDVDNLIAGINDILEKSTIIKDDDLIVSGCFKKIGGCAGWSTKITIREVSR